MSAPEIKNFRAWENRMPGPSGPALNVSGDVQTSRSNQKVILTERTPPGISPTTLMLDLTIESSGMGNDVMGSAKATFSKPVEKGQYTSVEIMWKNERLTQLDVGSAE